MVLANKYDLFKQEHENSIAKTNETVTRMTSEASIEIGGKAPRQEISRLYRTTTYLIKKRQKMRLPYTRDRIELAEQDLCLGKLVHT